MQGNSLPQSVNFLNASQNLQALRLPDLLNKRFLNIGCSCGYFCGYAVFSGASQVIGVDPSKTEIEKAKQRFPTVDFRVQPLDELPAGLFDTILLSNLHCVKDQEAIIHALLGKLDYDGLLILELGIAVGGGERWVQAENSTNGYFFPTRTVLASILKDYAWKIIGHTSNVDDDKIKTHVIHIKKMKPYAFLLLQEPATGKSTVSKNVFKNSDILLVSGDHIYLEISKKKLKVSLPLQQAISEDFSTTTILKTTNKIFDQGFIEELVDVWISKAGGYQDLVIDSYVPRKYREEVKEIFSEKGYFPVEMNMQQKKYLLPREIYCNKINSFEASLQPAVKAHMEEARFSLLSKIKRLISINKKTY